MSAIHPSVDPTKPRHLPPQMKATLEPFAEMYAEMYEAVRDLDDQGLRDLVVAANNVSTINCWCFTYHVAPVVSEWAQQELRVRGSGSQEAGS